MKTFFITSTIFTLSTSFLYAEGLPKNNFLKSIKPDAKVEYALKAKEWSGDVGVTANIMGLSIRPALAWSHTSVNSLGITGTTVTSTMPLNNNVSVYSEISLDKSFKYDDISIGMSYTF